MMAAVTFGTLSWYGLIKLLDVTASPFLIERGINVLFHIASLCNNLQYPEQRNKQRAALDCRVVGPIMVCNENDAVLKTSKEGLI